jgi:hypothetical protein
MMAVVAVAAAAVGVIIGAIVPGSALTPARSIVSVADPSAAANARSSAPAPLRISPATRTRFVRTLATEATPVLEGYFAGDQKSRFAQTFLATRASAEEYVGRGSGFVALAPPPAADRGGTITVILLTARSGPAGWRASRGAVGEDFKAYQQGAAAARGAQRAGIPTVTSTRYSGYAPTRLQVGLGMGNRWDALVVFSN